MFVDPTGMWLKGDERFEKDNPIVYAALEDLTKTWENLDTLEKSGVDVGNKKAEVNELANKVREIGDSIIVKKMSVKFLWKTANLNPTEAVIYASDKNKGWELLVAGNTAIEDTKKLFNNSSDATPANAFQHAYWNALATNKTKDIYYTKFYTDAHEYGSPFCTSTPEEFAKLSMDLFNNGVGRYQYSLNVGVSKDEIKQIIYKRLEVGGLKWINQGDLGSKYAP